MHEPLKPSKVKRLLEIKWNIREIFSESALISFFQRNRGSTPIYMIKVISC